jgi:hypothetical protein
MTERPRPRKAFMRELFSSSMRTLALGGTAMAVEALTACLAQRLWASYARSPQAMAAMER